jgi:uncharacterized protein YjbI with pentapeptide repeats
MYAYSLSGKAVVFAVVLTAAIGAFYYFYIQQYQAESFLRLVDSAKPTPIKPLETKDYIAIKRDSITSQNSSVFQLISSMLLLATAYTAWCNFLASNKKQVADKFSKAIDQLGNQDLYIRVGGIFLLEQIAQTEPEFHWTVMEVLSTYIRDKSRKGESILEPDNTKVVDNLEESNPVKKSDAEQDEENATDALSKPVISVTTDIQVALAVICRRNIKYDPKGKCIDLRSCDIRGADLGNAKLHKANLSWSTISKTHLENADLREANLSNATFNSACLEDATLQKANLTNAKLIETSLKRAKLNDSILTCADFSKSKLQGADLRKAKINLTNLKDAEINNETKIDEPWREIHEMIHEINAHGAKGLTLYGFDFSKAVLSCANFEGASLKKVKFSGANLSGAIFKATCLEEASFLSHIDDETNADIGADLLGANFSDANLKNAVFDKAKLQGTVFGGSDLNGAKFINCHYLGKNTFEGAKNLDKVEFKGSLGTAEFRDLQHQEINSSDDNSQIQ